MLKLIYSIILGIFLLSCETEMNDKSKYVSVNKNTLNTDSAAYSLNYQQGEILYATNCKQCHPVPGSKIICSDLMDRLFERLPQPSDSYFVKYVGNNRALRSQNDPYAIAIHQQFETGYDHYFQDSLSNQDFSDLILYLKGVELRGKKTRGG